MSIADVTSLLGKYVTVLGNAKMENRGFKPLPTIPDKSLGTLAHFSSICQGNLSVRPPPPTSMLFIVMKLPLLVSNIVVGKGVPYSTDAIRELKQWHFWAADVNRKFMFLLLARFHARPMSYKALILALQLNEKDEIHIKEEKSRLPVDVRGSKTSVLKLPIVSKIACQRMFQLSDPGVPRTFVEDCSFKPCRTRYESVNYGISNYWSA